MKRRSFLQKSLPMATLLPAVLDGFTLKAFAGNSLLNALALPPVETDHVLVIVQLAGGNDGLNTVIPLSNYNEYFNARTNIAIPQNKVLKLDGYDAAGLHPSLTGMQALYNEGKLGIVQSVGYPMPSFSHFRATDIWMSGSDSNATVNTGWAGRYLNGQYPGFPTGYPTAGMPDPLAIQIGSATSLTCQGPVVNMGMSITDPTSFYNLVNGINDPAPSNSMGYELSFVREVAQQTNKYATRIKNAATAVTQQSAYPDNNSLAAQLKIVARLIKGGLKTRIYMVSAGGFDTHALQANTNDTINGAHANLLGNVSKALKAFMDDLAYLQVDERVMGMTFSEFGRRIKSNASGGTDHGAAAPLFIFGKRATRTVLGTNPVIPANVTVNDNIPFQYDFRSVYASLMEKWFCVAPADLQNIVLRNFQSLNLVESGSCSSNAVANDDVLVSNYPNPFVESTTIRFVTRGGHTLIQVIDMAGHVLGNLIDKDYPVAGTYTVSFHSYGYASGVYYVRLQNGPVQQVRPMIKIH